MKEQMPAFLLAELYTDSIVYVNDEATQKSVKKDISQNKSSYLGNYERKIIVLTSDAENTYLSDDELNFLTGILNACKLNLAHIALINFYKDSIVFQHLKTELQPEFLLIFGISALQIELPFTMPHYQVQEYNKCKIITAPALTELNQPTQIAKTEKIKLWQSLQKMFSLE